MYAKPAWTVPDDFADNLDWFVLAREGEAQNDLFINSKDVLGFDKRSGKTYVFGECLEGRIPSKTLHAQTAGFSGVLPSLLGVGAQWQVPFVVFPFVSAQGANV